MPTVTVAGANSQTVTLSFDTNSNAVLAGQLAAAITAGVQGGSILPAVDTDGPPPTLPPGTIGEFIQTKDGTTVLPPGYKAFVNTAPEAIVFGSGGTGESVCPASAISASSRRGVPARWSPVAATISSPSPRPTRVRGRSTPAMATTLSRRLAAATTRSMRAVATTRSRLARAGTSCSPPATTP